MKRLELQVSDSRAEGADRWMLLRTTCLGPGMLWVRHQKASVDIVSVDMLVTSLLKVFLFCNL